MESSPRCNRSIAVDEAAHALRHYLGDVEADPARLDSVEARLATLEKLKRKYGAKLEDVLLFLETVKAELAAVEKFEPAARWLEKELQAALRILQVGRGEALVCSPGGRT